MTLLVLAAAAAVAVLPTEADLARALADLHGGAPGHVTGARCAPSSPGYIRCTYRQSHPKGYDRWAVLVSVHQGRWSVSEGPIREAPGEIRRTR